MNTRSHAPKPVVLVVDDEALLRLYAVDLLEAAGFETIEAANAEEALAIMRNRPDVRVLFTDIQMPGPFDGIELARRIHEQWPNVLLLVTSGNIRPEAGILPDDGHFLAKPYRDRDVLKEVESLISSASGGLIAA